MEKRKTNETGFFLKKRNPNSFVKAHLFQLLKQYEQISLPLDFFVGQYFRLHRALGANDRRFIGNSVFGMIRWLRLLDKMVGLNPTWEKRYQLFQNWQPECYFSNPTLSYPEKLSCPDDLWQVLDDDVGFERAVELCRVFNTQAPITIRVNPFKTTRDFLYQQLESSFSLSLCKHAPYGIQFRERAPLTSLDLFKAGLFEIQDEGSQLIAHMVKAKPGDQILDYCSGSGGKTLGFAHLLQGTGQIYLHDIRSSALQQAKKRCQRAGIQNVQFLHPTHQQLKKIKNKMDWVLVDAPCSGTGTLRRNPDQKWKFSNLLLQRLISEQREIFEQALGYLKPDGKIIYATCSILKKENQNQIDYFCDQFSLERVGDPLVLYPQEGCMDGFFATTMKKISTNLKI